jgi:hypothetical protein
MTPLAKKSALESQLEELDELKAKGTITDDELQSRRTALLSAVPAEEKKRGGCMRWGFGGCLVIFAVIGVLVVGLVILVSVAVSNDSGTKELVTGNASDVTVSVSGTTGLTFSGSVGSASGQRSVEGSVPASFTISGTGSSGIFTSVMQKKQESGTLTVTMNCRNGGNKSGDTTAAYGVVTVSCSP